LKDLNLCLLGAWVKRYIGDEGRLWRSIMDRKYCSQGNIFYADRNNVSPFWKGVLMVAQAIKFGYRWLPGDGKRVKFWDDTWFGTAPLVVQFWELYCICNEKTKSLAEVWVNRELRLTFRRTYSSEIMLVWRVLVEVVKQVNLNDEIDALYWCYEKSGTFSSHSCYAIINFRGVTPMYIPAIWNIRVPPKVKIFLWLLADNKLAIIDNLNKRGMHKPVQCCFCAENEAISHLFFECVVAKAVWSMVCEFLNIVVGDSYISVASKWLSREKHYSVNIITIAVLRGLWLTRNDMVFQRQVWQEVKTVLRRALRLTSEWWPLIKEEKLMEMKR
jgi:hypothetical protein